MKGLWGGQSALNGRVIQQLGPTVGDDVQSITHTSVGGGSHRLDVVVISRGNLRNGRSR